MRNLGISLGWILALLVGPALAQQPSAVPTHTASTAAGLMLGMEMQGDQLRQVSALKLASLPPHRTVAADAWEVSAHAPDGTLLWTRQVPAPDSFHTAPEQPVTLSLLTPWPQEGARLTLHDAQKHVRWEVQVDHTLLDAAQSRAAVLTAHNESLSGAPLAAATPGSSLARQLAAERPRADAFAQQRDVHHPSAIDALVQAKNATHLTRGKQVMSTLQHPTQTPLVPSRPLPQKSASTVAAKAAVSARVVLQDGSAPGVAFDAYIYRPTGTYVGYAPVPSDGNIVLDLPSNGNYRLDLYPPPPLREARIAFTYSGAALPNFVLETGWLLEVSLRDAASGSLISAVPTGTISYFNPGSNTVYGTPGGPGVLRFATPADPSIQLTLTVFGQDSFPTITLPLGTLDGDRNLDLALPASELTQFKLLPESGVQLSGPITLTCASLPSSNGLRFSFDLDFNATGEATRRLPPGLQWDCRFTRLPAPWVAPVLNAVLINPSTPFQISLTQGVEMTFDLRNEDGTPFTGAFHANATEALSGFTRAECAANPCAMRLPREIDLQVQFQFIQSGLYPPLIVGPESFNQSETRQLVVRRVHQISGYVLDGSAPSHPARVLAYDANGEFVISTSTDDQGLYTLPLLSGQYTVRALTRPEAVPTKSTAGRWIWRAPSNDMNISVSADAFLSNLSLPTAQGQIVLHVPRDNCGIGHGRALIALATSQDGQVAYSVEPDTRSACNAEGFSTATFMLEASPGTYALSFTRQGWSPYGPLPVTVTAGAQTLIDVPWSTPDRRWQPILSYADGMPVTGYPTTYLVDESQRYLGTLETSSGTLQGVWNSGWGMDIRLPEDAPNDSVRRVIRFDETPPAQVDFDRIELLNEPEAGLIRLYGNGDRARRFNIVFVAESYVAEKETFTDLNGNGIWDGVVWYDLNGDGVYDEGDWLFSYGNVAPPLIGSVPTTNNEPFLDLNGDGMLSLDDEALFLENTHAFMRSLLGSDFWSEHRDGFNAWALFEPSAQTGYDVIAADGTRLIERDTRYNASVELERSLLGVDRDAAIARALSVLPEVDVVIIPVNQPIPAGRPNVGYGLGGPGVMVYYGGLVETSPNRSAQSHEMGHFIARLADEYQEFPGINPRVGTPARANVSYRHRREDLPWGDLVAADVSLPSLDVDGGLGAFIGGDLYTDGAYRPTLNSTMRYDGPFFNEPSRQALEAAMQARKSGSPDLTLDKRGPINATVGVAYDYTLTLTNTGSAATPTAATIIDTIPANLTITSPLTGCTALGQVVSCTVASGLSNTAPNNTARFTITVTPTAALTGTTVTNIATVTGGGDPNCANTDGCNSPQVNTHIAGPLGVNIFADGFE